MTGRFEVYEDRAGMWRFRLHDDTGGIVAVGDPYTTREAAWVGCASVKRAADGAAIKEVDMDLSTSRSTPDPPLTLSQAVSCALDALSQTLPIPELDQDGNRIGPDNPAEWDGMDDDPQTVSVDLEALWVLVNHARGEDES